MAKYEQKKEEPKDTVAESPRKGAEHDTYQRQAADLLKFGEYSYDFIASTAERLLGGDFKVLDSYTPKVLTYVLVAAVMETRKKIHKLEKELGV